MIHRWRPSWGLAVAFAALTSGVQAAELLTIAEAQALAKETGRPILAMAGSKT